MKKFLLKVVLFFVLFAVPSALPIVVETAVRKHKLSLELPQDKTVLFIGDSHIAQGVNDKLIPGAFNWAKAGENYLNLFQRTRELLKANSQIRTVFIGTTPHSFNKNSDGRILTNGVLLQQNIIFYEPEDFWDCKKATLSTLKNLRQQRENTLGALNKKTLGTLKEFGGFESESTEGLRKDFKNNRAKKRFSIDYENFGNTLSVKYLKELVELVRARGVKIIFLNPPIYHAEIFFDVPYFENLIQEKFPDVEFWDYGDFPMPENCFANVNHLNGRGAEIFSKELARRMKEEGISDDGT